MDMDPGTFHTNVMGSSRAVLAPPKAGNMPVSSSENVPVSSAGLTRYHSAPSSMLGSLLDQDFYPLSDGSELAQFLNHGALASLCDSRLSLQPSKAQASSTMKDNNQQSYPNQVDMIGQHSSFMTTAGSGGFPEHITQGPLCAILEHGGEEPLVAQSSQQSQAERSSHRSMLVSNLHFNGLPPAKSNLIRHSSLPPDFLSRLVVEEMSERPLSQPIGPHVQSTPHMNPDETGGKVYLVTSKGSPRAVPIRNCFTDTTSTCKANDCSVINDELKSSGLLRQSSSPAGLLSQLSLDEFSSGAEKVTMSSLAGKLSARGMVGRKELGLIHGHGVGGWDEVSIDSTMQNIAALGQRKRGRDAEAKVFKVLPATDSLMGSMDHSSCPSPNHLTIPGISSADSMTMDSILCKSRAKRGCATHPRSIAERVRRTKISERMKKLQDLVPNLDKQAHMADMLDEVVEYVKLLQRQVQELSENKHECNGMCQKKGNTPLEM